jgi:hypothetical protein
MHAKLLGKVQKGGRHGITALPAHPLQEDVVAAIAQSSLIFLGYRSPRAPADQQLTCRRFMPQCRASRMQDTD